MRLVTQIVSAVAFIVFGFFSASLWRHVLDCSATRVTEIPDRPWKFGVMTILSASTFFSAWNTKASQTNSGETT